MVSCDVHKRAHRTKPYRDSADLFFALRLHTLAVTEPSSTSAAITVSLVLSLRCELRLARELQRKLPLPMTWAVDAEPADTDSCSTCCDGLH